MSESKSVVTEKCDQRPTMRKRVEQKEDGRVLIYYTFEASAPNDELSQTSKVDELNGAK